MLLSIQETIEKIKTGGTFTLAGDEKLLRQLPQGNWIAGTIPYFMAEKGGETCREKIYIQALDDHIADKRIAWYDEEHLEKIIEESPENGFSLVIIPASSKAHARYAQEAPDYKNLFYKQIIGWISGVHLDDLGKEVPRVMNGQTGELSDQKALVLHAGLPASKIASIGIINIFEQGTGDTITFETGGFQAGRCLINGRPDNLAEYLVRIDADTKLPLVADYHGAMVNVSFQQINEAEKTVDFYAPIFKDVEYKQAAPVSNYVEAFQSQLPKNLVNPVFTCNCILNYLYSELEGKQTGNLTGPITFGEIAYQLLNQTLVYLEILDRSG